MTPLSQSAPMVRMKRKAMAKTMRATTPARLDVPGSFAISICGEIGASAKAGARVDSTTHPWLRRPILYPAELWGCVISPVPTAHQRPMPAAALSSKSSASRM
jgi:hypothetical protein